MLYSHNRKFMIKEMDHFDLIGDVKFKTLGLLTPRLCFEQQGCEKQEMER